MACLYQYNYALSCRHPLSSTRKKHSYTKLTNCVLQMTIFPVGCGQQAKRNSGLLVILRHTKERTYA